MSEEFYLSAVAAKDRVFVPTQGIIPNGPIRNMKPVADVSIGDRSGLEALVKERIRQGNPVASHDDESPLKEAVKLVRARSGKQFAERTRSWHLIRDSRGWVFYPMKLHKSGFNSEDKDQRQILPKSQTIDAVVTAFVDMILKGNQ